MHNKGYLETICSYITFSFITGVEGNIRLRNLCWTTPEKVLSSHCCNTTVSTPHVVICSHLCSFITDFYKIFLHTLNGIYYCQRLRWPRVQRLTGNRLLIWICFGSVPQSSAEAMRLVASVGILFSDGATCSAGTALCCCMMECPHNGFGRFRLLCWRYWVLGRVGK